MKSQTNAGAEQTEAVQAPEVLTEAELELYSGGGEAIGSGVANAVGGLATGLSKGK